jgi:spore germination protein YaaH
MKKLLFFVSLGLLFVPIVSWAATAKPAPFTYAVWLPFWQSQNGAQDISLNLGTLKEVSPFSYEIVGASTIKDDLNIGNGSWDPWFSAVRELGIKIIPTIAWFDGNGIYNLLSNTKTRQAHEDAIATLVKSQNFDGIDIDYESMTAATRPYFSLLIQGLAQRLHPQKKLLTCTVVPRMPLSSLYRNPPTTTATYAENYSVLNQYCDEVRLMAYDQGPIDINLNDAKGNGMMYAPVADPAWAQKVIAQATPYISPKKIMLGIPTYGYEWEVSWQNGQTTYRRVRSFTYLQAMDRAEEVDVTPVRNNAGEMSFTFVSSTFINSSPILTTVVSSTIEPPLLILMNGGNINGSAATTLFYVSFPDATSAATEIALAKQLGLKGAAFFKADGQLDPMTWEAMK